ncbi:MAG: 30S ribosomal protein S12 methylthiotransferase RimO [Oscillospiraceae bacterium]|nr:30S ribosomal protein S12 methylthiotransferase RimO [Oscillospiraceae bacterium]
MNKPVKVALIAMGCEKNVVNSEQMLYLLDKAGFELVGDPNESDVTIVNTCGFTESAREEAMEQIYEVLDCGCKLIVAGCLPEYHKLNPVKGLARADGLVGTGKFDDVVEAVSAVMDGQTPVYYGNLSAPVSETPRIYTGPPGTAYVKLAEGCGNRCSYCVIPALRGPYRPRTADAVLAEAGRLVRGGVTELILVAQDVTQYPDLPGLLNRLCEFGGLRRVRLHYLYPSSVTDELIDVIAAQPKIARYLDIPIQHASDAVLKAMNRRYTRADLESLILKLRGRIPGVVLRTSVIVGFPGETKADFEELCDFLQWAQIPRAGVFAYSREEGTAAASLPLQLTETVAARRLKRVEVLQSRVIDGFNREREGSVVEVLTDGYDDFAKLYYGRSGAESPDIDGVVFFTSPRRIQPGEWARVLMDGAVDGDGKGRVVE